MHSEFTQLMSLVLDQEALPDEEHRLRQHMADCRTCEATWRQWQVLDTRFRSEPLRMAPDGFAERVSSRLDERRQIERRQWLTGALSLGLLLALLGSVLVLLIASLSTGVWSPQSVAQLITDGAQVLFGLTMVVRAGQIVAEGLAGLPLALGAGVCTVITAGLGLVWFWLMLRHTTWLHAQSTARNVSES